VEPVRGVFESEWRLLFLCIAESVAFLRSHYVVHRDIKDDNFFIAEDRRPLIADFGAAMWLRDPPTERGGEWTPKPFVPATYEPRGNGFGSDPFVARIAASAAAGMTYEEVFDKADV